MAHFLALLPLLASMILASKPSGPQKIFFYSLISANTLEEKLKLVRQRYQSVDFVDESARLDKCKDALKDAIDAEKILKTAKDDEKPEKEKALAKAKKEVERQQKKLAKFYGIPYKKRWYARRRWKKPVAGVLGGGAALVGGGYYLRHYFSKQQSKPKPEGPSNSAILEKYFVSNETKVYDDETTKPPPSYLGHWIVGGMILVLIIGFCAFCVFNGAFEEEAGDSNLDRKSSKTRFQRSGGGDGVPKETSSSRSTSGPV